MVLMASAQLIGWCLKWFSYQKGNKGFAGCTVENEDNIKSGLWDHMTMKYKELASKQPIF